MFKSTKLLLGALLLVLVLPSAALADLTPPPSSYDYGSVDYRLTTASHEFVFTNNQLIPTNNGDATINGSNASEFNITADTCSGKLMFIGDSCSVFVNLSPDSIGLKTAQLRIDDTLGSVTVDLSGLAEGGSLVVNPNPIIFTDSQPYYFGGQFQSASITNTGFSTQIGGVQIIGPDASKFTINFDGCSSQVIAKNSNCSLGLNFKSLNAGTFTASLRVVSDSANSPQLFPIEAQAFGGPESEVTPGSKDFGKIKIGDESEVQTFTITNNGDFPQQTSQILIVSNVPTMFPISNDQCTNENVEPGDSCTFDLRFVPTSQGNKDATILVTSNTSQQVAQVLVSGQGVAPALASAAIEGNPRVGETLTCDSSNTQGDVLTYRWLRDGQFFANQTHATYALANVDLNRRISCQVVASDELGTSSTSTSPQVGPIAPRDLSVLPETFVGRTVCRKIFMTPSRLAEVSGISPATAESPLRLTANKKLTVTIASIKRGPRERIYYSPRSLDNLADGMYKMTIKKGSRTETLQIVLSPCDVSAKVVGSESTPTTYAISGSSGMAGVHIHTPSLNIDNNDHKVFGEVTINSFDQPDQVFLLREETTKSNSIKVRILDHAVHISNLPEDTGRASISFKENIVSGKNGLATAHGVWENGTKIRAQVRTSFLR